MVLSKHELALAAKANLTANLDSPFKSSMAEGNQMYGLPSNLPLQFEPGNSTTAETTEQMQINFLMKQLQAQGSNMQALLKQMTDNESRQMELAKRQEDRADLHTMTKNLFAVKLGNVMKETKPSSFKGKLSDCELAHLDDYVDSLGQFLDNTDPRAKVLTQLVKKLRKAVYRGESHYEGTVTGLAEENYKNECALRTDSDEEDFYDEASFSSDLRSLNAQIYAYLITRFDANSAEVKQFLILNWEPMWNSFCSFTTPDLDHPS